MPNVRRTACCMCACTVASACAVWFCRADDRNRFARLFAHRINKYDYDEIITFPSRVCVCVCASVGSDGVGVNIQVRARSICVRLICIGFGSLFDSIHFHYIIKK